MKATQVIFRELDTDNKLPFVGIKIDDEGVICAECGGFFEMEDVEIVKEYPDWVDFSEGIAGDEYNELMDSVKNEG